ncbi:MAG: hypothetical protein MSS60_11165, partial [Clostridiales bacterium]|nr:hypothetical protein [Clostridiales bacterium]
INKTVNSVRLCFWHKAHGIHGSHSAAALCISTKFLYYFIVLLTGSSSAFFSQSKGRLFGACVMVSGGV